MVGNVCGIPYLCYTDMGFHKRFPTQLYKYTVEVRSGSTLGVDALHWTFSVCEEMVGTGRTCQ